MGSRGLVSLLLLLFVSSTFNSEVLSFNNVITPAERKSDTTGYSYNLRFIKNAAAPKHMRLINTGNIGIKGKNLVSNGILFTYKNRKASSVQIAGNFSLWKPAQMERNENGVWYYFLDENESDLKIVTYKYLVDSTWISDPMNYDNDDDGTGSFLSIINNSEKSFSKNISFRNLGKNLIEFRIYNPEAKFISLVGDFNNWNPENDILKKGKDGIWRLKKRVPSGSYLYRYIIDGNWVQDIFNPKSASDISGDLCSVIEIN